MDFWATAQRVGECLFWAGDPALLAGKTAAETAWDTTYGPRIPGHTAQSHCGNTKCVEPRHLMQVPVLPGSPAGQRTFGSRNGKAKLTEALVRELRRRATAGESQEALAAAYRMSQPTVSRIINRKTWPHV